MPRSIKLLAAVIAGLVLALGTYHFASPKVELENRGDIQVEELSVQLPSSRVSIGPLESGGHARVYFMPQTASGEAKFRVLFGDGSIRTGKFPYAGDGQFFRAVRFTVEATGVVNVIVSG